MNKIKFSKEQLQQLEQGFQICVINDDEEKDVTEIWNDFVDFGLAVKNYTNEIFNSTKQKFEEGYLYRLTEEGENIKTELKYQHLSTIQPTIDKMKEDFDLIL